MLIIICIITCIIIILKLSYSQPPQPPQPPQPQQTYTQLLRDYLGDDKSSPDIIMVLNNIYNQQQRSQQQRQQHLQQQVVANYFQDWMARLGPQARLTKIAIPGTHNSLLYGNCDNSILNPWLQFQSTDIPTQLYDGIRYFDFKVCLVNNVLRPFNKNWKCEQGIDYLKVLESIRDFLTKNTKEILIINLTAYEGDEFVVAENTVRYLKDLLIKPIIPSNNNGDIGITPLMLLTELRMYGNIMIVSSIQNEYFFQPEFINAPIMKEVTGRILNADELYDNIDTYYRNNIISLSVLSSLCALAVFNYTHIKEFAITNYDAALLINKVFVEGIISKKIIPVINRERFNLILVDFYRLENVNQFIINLNQF